MNQKAGITTPLNSRYEILTDSDEVYVAGFKDKNGNRILNPTDFAVEFFIENRTHKGLICYREGNNPPVGCEIMGDGSVIFFLPKNKFVEGNLLYEINISKKWSGFPPSGIFTRKRIFRTGYTYIQGR